MGCRIGMATDVAARVDQLKRRGDVPSHAGHRTLKTNLTYEEAQAEENRLRAACGPDCQGSSGGGRLAGRAWKVYRIDW